MITKAELQKSLSDIFGYFGVNGTDPKVIEKTLVDAYRYPKYYAVQGKNIVNLGFDVPEDAVVEDHDLVGRYGLFIVRVVKDFSVEFDFQLLGEDVTTDEAQNQALILVENNKNTIEEVRVGIGVSLTFASRPVFKGFVLFVRVAASDTVEKLQLNDPTGEDLHVDTLLNDVHGKKKKKIQTKDSVYKSLCKCGCAVHKWSDFYEMWVSKDSGKSCVGKRSSIILHVDIIKSDLLEKGLVYGIVYEPEVVDTHGDFTSKDEIERAAHNFLPKAVMNLNHQTDLEKVSVVESYIAPLDFSFSSGEPVRKGAWVLVSKVFDEQLKKDILAGDITGYSLEGTAQKI